MLDINVRNIPSILVGVSMGLVAASVTTAIVAPKKEGEEPVGEFATLGISFCVTAAAAAAGIAIDAAIRKL